MPIPKVELDARWARDQTGARAQHGRRDASRLRRLDHGHCFRYSYSLPAEGNEGGFPCPPQEER